ncbi:MAG: hypothetical protein HC800_25830 [Phormidesmis sp. RL_2_1]|nr:hypothetical protein [Phormidesmis sp. RL_2_1]
MTITAQAPDIKLAAPESLLRGQSCKIWQLLNQRLSLTHPKAVDARYTHTVKVLLTKPTLGYSPEAELDELVLSLTLKSDPTPIRKTLETYTAEEFPGWTMREWWTTADLFEDAEPF